MASETTMHTRIKGIKAEQEALCDSYATMWTQYT